MLHSCKEWSDILKVVSVGGGEAANLKACHFSHFQFQLCHQRSLLKCHSTFYIYGQLVKKVSFRFLKHALFIELLPRISWRTFEGQCLYILLDTTYQKSEWPFFDQWSIDVKSVVTFQKWPLVVELKLKTWKMTSLQIYNVTSTNRCYF